MHERWYVEPGTSFDLRGVDPSSSSGVTNAQAASAELVTLQERLLSLQERLWAEHRQSLLLVLQGIDASGKDGTISHVFRGVNPQGTRVSSFKEPTPIEFAHDFLWRIHRAVPGAGEIGIFNRSHYEDVLSPRVHHLVEEAVWRVRYDDINAFEALLAHRGTTTIKVLLHISRDEQRQRLLERATRPDKRWKFRESDLNEREFWDEYQKAFSEMVSHTSTKLAPWFVVPANHKWYRNWAVSHLLVETLEQMDPRYPETPPVEDLDRL